MEDSWSVNGSSILVVFANLQVKDIVHFIISFLMQIDIQSTLL